ncbi:MAG: hypothetical protein QME64_12975 [bacterium]|nr:hypothetical protein [bacterium]
MQCTNHIDREAVAMCISCRNFFCADCKTVIDGKNYCLPCAEKIQPAPAPPAQQPEVSSEPTTAPAVPSAPRTPPPSAPATAKKKSGCLKWAIIGIAIFLLLTVVLGVILYIGWNKYIVPKIQQQTEQPFAESTPSETTPSETEEPPESIAEDSSQQTRTPAESEPAQASETPAETGMASQPVPSEPFAPPPPGIIPPPKPVPAVEYSKLTPYLPNQLSNWRVGNTRGGKFEQENYPYTSAEREYINPREKSKITITISDYGRNPRMYQKFHRPAIYSNADGYQKLVRIYGYPAIEKMEYNTKIAELSIEVARRYVIEINGENITDVTILTMYANQFDLTKLSQLR